MKIERDIVPTGSEHVTIEFNQFDMRIVNIRVKKDIYKLNRKRKKRISLWFKKFFNQDLTKAPTRRSAVDKRPYYDYSVLPDAEVLTKLAQYFLDNHTSSKPLKREKDIERGCVDRQMAKDTFTSSRVVLVFKGHYPGTVLKTYEIKLDSSKWWSFVIGAGYKSPSFVSQPPIWESNLVRGVLG